MNGSQMVIEALKKEGVTTVFGYPGGAVIPLFDALYDEKAIRVILTRHEQAAVHAADGYARSTGKTGVVIATSGPGATNTITGLATANFDSVPLLCITGQVPTAMIGNDAFQEADTVGISRPVCKHNYLVTKRDELGQTLKNAFVLTQENRPGPVLVDIPKDVLQAQGDSVYPLQAAIRGIKPTIQINPSDLQNAKEMLMASKKPVFFIGGGLIISEASSLFRTLSQKTGIPVVSTLMGMGAIDSAEKMFLGMIGMHGSYAANMAVTECDLLFSLGVRFDDRATGKISRFAPNAKILQVDIDQSSIGKIVTTALGVNADLKDFLSAFDSGSYRCPLDWKESVIGFKTLHPVAVVGSKDKKLHPSAVIDHVAQMLPEALVTSEVGQNQMWTAQYFRFQTPRTWITSGGLGTMGYGFPASMGVKMAHPDKTVINFAGDGSIQMNIQEMATCVIERIPVINIILNNGYLGMVRQWQEMFNSRRYSSTDLAPAGTAAEKAYVPDFVKLAEAYSALAFRVTTLDELTKAVTAAAAEKERPTIIEVIISREANVYPMVPPGAGIDEMILEDKA